MKDQPNNFFRKTNRLAIVSLMTGVLALIPYLPDLVLVLGYLLLGSSNTFEKLRDLVLPVTLIAGAIHNSVGFLLTIVSISTMFSILSLVISNRSLIQIRSGDNVEKGHTIAITAKGFGILSLVTNVGFGIGLFFLFTAQ